VVEKIESHDKNLNKIDSIFMNYDISSFKIIEENYHYVNNNNKTLFILFKVSKEKIDLINNADSAVQSYWIHIHNDQIYAPSKFKGFNYKPS
ncbi:292_t:CDS:2, partial [Funneliformis geosporum]